MDNEKKIVFYRTYIKSLGIYRGVSRRLSRRRRLEIFNFFRPSAAAAKKLLDNRRRRLRDFNFFLFVGGGGWKLFGSRRRRLKSFQKFLKKFLRFEKFLHKKKGEMVIENRLIRN